MLIYITAAACPSAVFFFNDTATTEIYTLSLHDALPISRGQRAGLVQGNGAQLAGRFQRLAARSEEHTSELQSRLHLVCRLLLEKKKTSKHTTLLPHTSRELHDPAAVIRPLSTATCCW